jgi:short-subunit dehydrogenase
MNITIIGASAGIGLETVKRGLNRNHSITTLSRTEIKIEEKKSDEKDAQLSKLGKELENAGVQHNILNLNFHLQFGYSRE